MKYFVTSYEPNSCNYIKPDPKIGLAMPHACLLVQLLHK